ncbi:MAG: ketopantoate reductase family protein [Acidimicrobiales bacterium]
MRYVILGAGAIGGAIGGRLSQHGHDVILIARGAHLDMLRSKGLELRDPTGSVTLDVPAVGSPAEAAIEPGDTIIVATKTQQTEGALLALQRGTAGSPGIHVVCAQNGVENERLALRRFESVYAMRVILAGTHLEPGVVEIATAPVSGLLDIGRYPAGTDEVADRIAADLRASSFDAEATAEAMAHKYSKLLSNLANSLEAACGTLTGDETAGALLRAAREEAKACYIAAGVTVADEIREQERRRTRGLVQPVGGVERSGGSSWQSLERATGDIEADWLNGEIVLLGRLHGIPTPVNACLQEIANKLAREHTPPGSMTSAEVAAGLL